METLVLDITVFRAQFPAYSDPVLFPDATIQMYFDTASNYISTQDFGILNGTSRLLALYLMTAHIADIMSAISSGQPKQALLNATEGTVTVGFVPPPVTDGFQWWLNATAYGQQLWALLLSKSAGGLYIGGSNARFGFRRTDGSFFRQ